MVRPCSLAPRPEHAQVRVKWRGSLRVRAPAQLVVAVDQVRVAELAGEVRGGLVQDPGLRHDWLRRSRRPRPLDGDQVVSAHGAPAIVVLPGASGQSRSRPRARARRWPARSGAGTARASSPHCRQRRLVEASRTSTPSKVQPRSVRSGSRLETQVTWAESPTYLTGPATYLDRQLTASESRTITRGTVPETFTPITRSALPHRLEQTALRIGDVFAAVRLLSDAVAALPLKVYRRHAAGRASLQVTISRSSTLLRRPSPGTTSVDLAGQLDGPPAHLRQRGTWPSTEARVRSCSSVCSIQQSVVVEQVGARVVYTVSRLEGFSEHSVDDIVHVKALSARRRDGDEHSPPGGEGAAALRGPDLATSRAGSAMTRGRAESWRSAEAPPDREGMHGLKEQMNADFGWDRTPPGHGSVAVMTGELSYVPVDPPAGAPAVHRAEGVLRQRGGASVRDPRLDARDLDRRQLTYSNTSEQVPTDRADSPLASGWRGPHDAAASIERLAASGARAREQCPRQANGTE